MTDQFPTKQEKCQGAMVATAIGDALGWPNERAQNKVPNQNSSSDMFVSWTRTIRFPHWHQEPILAGEYSDDTQMVLAVSRSILTEKWEYYFTKHELPFWLSYERGGGNALKQAAKACKENVVLWKQKNPKDYFAAGGNGAAMRILPHVIGEFRDKSIAEILCEVTQDSIITHGHPRALLGATCFAYALYYLLNKEDVLKYGELASAVIESRDIWGKVPDTDALSEWFQTATEHSGYDYVQVWNQTVDHMIAKLRFISDSLDKGLIVDDKKILTDLECFSKVKGAGDVATLAAIFLASKYANNPTLGIKVPAFSKGIDTDTIASMTGALLGMIGGTNWIPSEWRSVQDYDCLVKMTELLMAEHKLESSMHLINKASKDGTNWYKTQVGILNLIESYSIKSKKANVIIRKTKTAFGQTLYLKEYIANESEELKKTSVPTTTLKKIESESKSNLQFRLDITAINDLQDNQQLSKKTFSKMLQIIAALIEGESEANVAKRFNVDHKVVNALKRYIM